MPENIQPPEHGTEWLVRFGPAAIPLAAARLRDSGFVAILADGDAGVSLPPPRNEERYAASARPDGAAFLLRRGIARALAAEATGRPPRIIRFRAAAGGKPRICAGRTTLFLSFAARGRWNLVGLARVPIGIDIEFAPDEAMIPWNILREDERALLRRHPPGERGRAFVRLWTAKEAALKAVGTGLMTPPEAVRLVPGAVCIAGMTGETRLDMAHAVPDPGGEQPICCLALLPRTPT